MLIDRDGNPSDHRCDRRPQVPAENNRMTQFSPFQCLTLALMALLVANSSVHAEGVDANATTGKSDEATLTLAVTKVTAQHREEDVASVPLAISVIEPDTLSIIGASARDILVLSEHAPSLHGESSFGRTFPRFYIRGLGNTDFDLNASQPVSLVYDGVVMENPTLKGFPIFDLDRVEILRGPQGTLFGRNTPGGVVKFESVRPSFVPDGYARFGYGRFDTYNVEAAIGGPVSEHSAGRISALYQRRDGFSSNSVLGDQREGFVDRAIRGQWLYRPNDDFEALVQVRARSLDGGSQVYRANSIVPGTNQQPQGFERFSLAQDARPTLNVDTFGTNLQLRWNLDGMRITSISAYESVDMFARGDVDGGFGADFTGTSGPGSIPFPAESGDGIPSHRQLTQEFRIESDNDSRVDWQAGAFLFDESLDIENFSYDTLADSIENGYARQHQSNRAYAVFAGGGYRLADDWRLGAGARFTRDEKDFWAERLVSPFGEPLPRIRVNPSDNNLSGDINLTWTPSEIFSAHARVASAFRAPAIQGRVLFGDTVSVADSETIVSSELGFNADLFDRRARLGLNLFHYQLDSAQLTAVGGGANFNTLINADKVIGQGVELEFEALLGEHFRFNSGASYNDTEIRDPNLGVQPCAAPCTVLDPPGSVAGTVAINGNSLPQAPRWIGYLSANYSRPIGNGEWYAQTDISHRSKIGFFLYNSREFTGPELSEVGFRTGYRWNQDRYEVAVLGRNLFNRVVAVGGVDFNNLTAFFNEPRYYGIEFTARL